jgi:hypothetical protein
MSVASRPVSTGKTRTCPHCKATILESLSICPGCMHHLRFDSEAAKRQVAAAPALRVEGIIRHPPLEQPLEYFVIIAIRNDRGEEVTRQVVNVGALQAAEKRTFTLSVEVLPPQAPVPSKSTSATGTFKAPLQQPSATVRPSAPAQSSASTPSQGSASTSSPGSNSAPQPAPASPSATAPTGSASGTPSVRTPTSSPQAPQERRSAVNPATTGNPSAMSNPGAAGSPKAPAPPPPNASGPAGASGPANPASPAKPSSGYVLKPPSPGGPKRH